MRDDVPKSDRPAHGVQRISDAVRAILTISAALVIAALLGARILGVSVVLVTTWTLLFSLREGQENPTRSGPFWPMT